MIYVHTKVSSDIARGPQKHSHAHKHANASVRWAHASYPHTFQRLVGYTASAAVAAGLLIV